MPLHVSYLAGSGLCPPCRRARENEEEFKVCIFSLFLPRLFVFLDFFILYPSYLSLLWYNHLMSYFFIFNVRKFEELAVGVLTQCHRADPKTTHQMLHIKSPLFGSRDCIEVQLCSLYQKYKWWTCKYLHVYVMLRQRRWEKIAIDE